MGSFSLVTYSLGVIESIVVKCVVLGADFQTKFRFLIDSTSS